MNKNRFVFPMLLVSLFSISLSSCNDNKISSPVVSTPGSETPSTPEKPSESTKPSESVKPSSPVVSSPIENPGNQKEMIVFHYINEESQDYENYGCRQRRLGHSPCHLPGQKWTWCNTLVP